MSILQRQSLKVLSNNVPIKYGEKKPLRAQHGFWQSHVGNDSLDEKKNEEVRNAYGLQSVALDSTVTHYALFIFAQKKDHIRKYF